jgi:putative ABC transport system permease protein
MFKNYIKIAWRNLFKDKLYSMVNILGLSIGITCCVIIYLYVSYELSYDMYHEKASRIYRMTSAAHEPTKVDYFAPTSPIMASSVKENFPEVESIVRFQGSKRILSYNENKFPETKLIYSDSNLLDVFSFPVIQGQKRDALQKPYSIVLTESTAKKYFGNEPAAGKIMKLSDTINFTVTAVIKDIPQNSHFNFDCFLSRNTILELNKGDSSFVENNELNWFNCNTYSYLLIKPDVDIEKLKTKINTFMDKETADIKKESGMWMNMDLQALSEIHLKSNLESDYPDSRKGDITSIYIFIGTAILMLLIACCNFINLSTAKSINRSKEIGLRKVIGATRKQLITQFIGESLFFTIISSIISIGLVFLLLPSFNSFIGFDISVTSDTFLIYGAIIICVGILSGAYPALLMSSFSPIRSIKGHIKHGLMDVLFRKGLVVFQFAIAVALIICSTIVLNQLDFIQNKNIGMNKEQLLALEFKPQDAGKAEVILKELQQNPKVSQATINSFSFKRMSNITLLPEGTPANRMTSCSVFSADENFFNTFQIPIVAGRDFSKKYATDVAEAFIVNEAAVKEFGWKTPQAALGKKVDWAFGKSGKIVGVVKDFNYSSLKEEVKPILIHVFPNWFSTITLRLKTDDLTSTLAQIETSWKSIATNSPFKYSFIEDDFDSLYQSEIKMRTMLGTFTFLAILVACLGLFGLAAFTIKQRYREIGIRKVLGSSVNGIVKNLSIDFLKLVVISIIIAIPLAWYAAYKWLQDFAFKIEISVWTFVLASTLSIIIALITVCFQALRAAYANPIKSLRAE